MWPPYAVLAAVLLATALAALYARSSSRTNDRLRFDNAVQRTEEAIRDRLETYVDSLRAGAGLFAADREVSRDEFRRFVQRVEVEQRYPGIQGIGFAARVGAQDRGAFVERVRAQGAGDFQIKPEGERAEYVVVTYLEPLDERNRAAIGYDMFSDPARREAMERARDTGQAAATARVTLVQEIDAQKQAGFLIYVPVYRGGVVPAGVEERRASLRGFVYAPFRADDLLRGIFGTMPAPLCDVSVYDGTSPAPENLMHRSDIARGEAAGESYTPRFTTTKRLDVEGRPWIIVYFTRPSADIASEDWGAPLIALAGLLFGLVIFFFMRAQVRSRAASEESLRARQYVEDRLRALVDASRTLLSSPELGDVLPAVLRLSNRLIAADAYAIWKYEPGSGHWAITAAEGLSDEYRRDLIAITPGTPSMPDRPLAFEDVYSEKFVGDRAGLYRGEGIRSLLSLPLKIRGEVVGTLVFYYREPHRFDEAEIDVATALTNLAASAIGTSELYQAQRRSREEAEAASRRSAFLAEATGVLASSLDYEQTLRALAVFAVPHVADWCAVDVLGDDGKLRRLAVAHVQPEKVVWAQEIERRYPTDPEAPHGVPNVVRTGRSELYAEITDEMLARGARDEEHLRILRDVGFTSVMIVPLVARGRPSGAMTFVTAESGRRYGPPDLAFAEDLAHRAALSVDNARLYKEAQEANRLKDEFLATLSHELRTPLTSVLGWAKLLRSEALDEKTAARAVEAIERNAEAQTRLINDLLDVSRVITGKLRLEVKATELGGVVEAAVESVRPAAEARGVRLDVRLDPSAGPVSGDADRLQQVVWNLLSNAIKFTPGGGHVEVILTRANGNAEIAVADTGRGIAPEFLPHVFDRFRQADQRITREFGGLGLGLAIARHLVELHGGTITAASEGVGRGATFRVRLPLMGSRNAEFGARTEGQPNDNGDQRSAILSGLHVLVVEDDEDSRVLVSTALERFGARVTAAASAAEALGAVERQSPDVIVADIGMPGTDGYELMRMVRALGGEASRLPAVALTAYARPEDRERALASGYQAHVAKPVEPSALAQTLARLVGRKGEEGVGC
jgi:signal transduction histidine kinase/CHASE1-domain containing sensor protein/ActR/RegA family two-component response regulator